jgi:hypothetical protein
MKQMHIQLIIFHNNKMPLHLKGKRGKTTSGNVKQKRQRQLLLLDLPELKAVEGTVESVETGYQTESKADTFQEDKNATIQNAIQNGKDEYKGGAITEKLPSGNIVLENLDLETLLPSEKEGRNAPTSVKKVGESEFKAEIIPLTHQKVSDEKLADQSFSYGPLNDAFWEKFRDEVSKALRRHKPSDTIQFEAAPEPESVRKKMKKPVVYAAGSSSQVIRF